ncbi:3-hydroxyisobutyrate dehydrogenase [Stakelama marina]|uniref:3-hydroxyisobutyrate dehydrogenase n=1 Tax=Stakelama marina TaxID=2826939 RepID=A0A8T4IF82_9SPHN|nr:3-hydroxyisobutyrate dehydrogenase [Stakelama marina]MBR0552514.1 3-hydroxyisobutyrate dehydrogenase [Stakelama marina]
MARVGFIGLGNMGGGMAANLAKAGHDVHAFDLSEEALANAKANGCLPVESAAKAAEGAEAVITMLPAGKHVAEVYRDSVFGIADTGAVLIDCSTIDVATARDVADQAAAKGLLAVDAPVSGGIAGAQGGTLTFMVGGTDEAFERAQPFLEDMGKAVIHAGGSGTGQTAKMCNNMILGATMIATCESFVMAKKLGLDPQKFYDIASVSTAQSWSMTSYCPVPGVGPEAPSDRDYAGGFATGLMLKDLRLAMDAAATVDADTPMGARATELYQKFAEEGHAGLDFSAIIKMLAHEE